MDRSTFAALTCTTFLLVAVISLALWVAGGIRGAPDGFIFLVSRAFGVGAGGLGISYVVFRWLKW